MKISRSSPRTRSRRAFHEVMGAVIGALGSAGFGWLLAGALGAFVGAIAGVGMGALASAAAEDNAAELAAQDTWANGLGKGEPGTPRR
jgi:uncharacterized membrane protein